MTFIQLLLSEWFDQNFHSTFLKITFQYKKRNFYPMMMRIKTTCALSIDTDLTTKLNM